MANRAYLYAIKGNKIIGISEYNYEIPIAYKVLLSQNTKKVKSKIYKTPFKIALQGDFTKGVERLNAFMEELKRKDYFKENELEKEIEATKVFFQENSDYDYFYLDCTEIYEMESGSLYLNNRKTWKQILNINNEIEKFYNEIEASKEKTIEEIGIQEWSNVLFYGAEENEI